jgi:molecular chaperone GrpE
MSESPPQDIAQDAFIPGVPSLTPDAIGAVIDDFRGWLTSVSAGKVGTAPPAGEEVDLYTLVGQFTALRQEVNLQTRAARAQQEQNAETLRQLAETVEFLTQPPPQREAPADDGIRPLLKTLVDLYDAVALAARELQRGQDAASAALRAMEDAAPARPSGWARWFGRPETQQKGLRSAVEGVEKLRQTLAATAAGYAMTLQRVERSMAQHGLDAIPAVGQAFDPELMEALEVVFDSGAPSGEVVQEVRRGYLWNGRVFRYAQVRVAKNSP